MSDSPLAPNLAGRPQIVPRRSPFDQLAGSSLRLGAAGGVAVPERQKRLGFRRRQASGITISGQPSNGDIGSPLKYAGRFLLPAGDPKHDPGREYEDRHRGAAAAVAVCDLPDGGVVVRDNNGLFCAGSRKLRVARRLREAGYGAPNRLNNRSPQAAFAELEDLGNHNTVFRQQCVRSKAKRSPTPPFSRRPRRVAVSATNVRPTHQAGRSRVGREGTRGFAARTLRSFAITSARFFRAAFSAPPPPRRCRNRNRFSTTVITPSLPPFAPQAFRNLTAASLPRGKSQGDWETHSPANDDSWRKCFDHG